MRRLLGGTLAALSVSLAGCVAFDPVAREEAFKPASVTLNEVQGRRGAIALSVTLGDPAKIALDKTPYELLFAAGAAAVPLAVINPFYVFGVFIPVIGTPMNATFNSRRDILTRAVAAEPLTAALLRALEREPALERIDGLARLDITIAAYGLAPRSGATLSSISPSEPLCLGGSVLWRATLGSGAQARERSEWISLGAGPTGQPNREGLPVPPAYCMNIEHFAADDGRLLRQAIRELAQVFAALIVRSLEAQ